MHQPKELPKELHFFDEFWRRSITDLDIARYHAYFARPEGVIVGEWTPRYMADFWTPPLLKRAAPDAKILVLLRDPISRYESALVFNLVTKSAPLHPLVSQEAIARGFYFQQLSHLLTYFERDRVLVLQYERCRSDAQGELARTYDFLGIDTAFVPARLADPVNPTPVKKPEVPEDTRAMLQSLYRDDLTRLAEAFPELDLSLWPSYSGRS